MSHLASRLDIIFNRRGLVNIIFRVLNPPGEPSGRIPEVFRQAVPSRQTRCNFAPAFAFSSTRGGFSLSVPEFFA